MTAVQLRIKQFSSVNELVEELEGIVTEAHNTICVNPTAEFAPDYYAYLVNELEQVGWKNIHDVNEELTKITLIQKTVLGCVHYCTVEFNPSSYKTTCASLNTQLPEEMKLSEMGREGLLSSVLKMFSERLKQYEELWLMLQDLDDNTWVLEPKTPNPSDINRRIVLENNCSIEIELSVDSPRSICDCRFLGKDIVVKPLLERFNRNAHKWNWELTVRENLIGILETTFPSKQKQALESIQKECGICYTFRYPLEDGTTKLPDQYCGKCGRPYHVLCLSEWLRSLPSTHQSFDTLFGTCIYCSSEISVRVT